MQGRGPRQNLRIIGVIAVVFCTNAVGAYGQQTPKLAALVSSGPETASEVRTLSELIGNLQMQVQALNEQLTDLRAEQQRTSEEAHELRHELDLVRAQGQTTAPGIPSVPENVYSTAAALHPVANSSAAPSPATAQEPAATDRIAKLEESQEVLEGKVNDQYQTKVESGSKYRVRLSGIVLLNLYDTRGPVDNQDFPQLAPPPQTQALGLYASPNTFGGSLRQSQIKLQAFGPDIAGARTSADVEFDFAGGFTDQWNGVAMGLVRMRTATMRLDWMNTSIIAGQDSLFFAPLAPTSLASMAIPALSYSGNLWAWTPQVRIEHRIALSDVSNIQLQAGILDSLTGDPPDPNTNNRVPNWGEESGQPAYAARVAWSHRAFGQNLTAGAAGYYGRQNWGFGRTFDGWAGTADLTLPLGKMFEFTGAFYRGRGVAGLGGGIGQSVLLNGGFMDPATRFRGLDSIGGWAQLKYKPTTRLQINGALGVDNPFANEMRMYAANAIYFPLYSRNLTPIVNFIYQVRSDVLISTEYRWLKTSVLDGSSNSANYVNLTLGYIF